MHRFANIELRAISVNTLFQFLIRISTSIPPFVATILVAYYAGFETLGSFTKIVTFVSIFYLLLDFGMNSVFLKLHFENTKENLGNLIVLRVLVAIILLPIVFIFATLLPHNLITGTGFSEFEKLGIVIYSFTLVTSSLVLSLQSYLQKKLSYSVSFLPSLFSSFILLFIIIFAAKTQNLPLLLFSYVISGGILFASLLYVMQKKYDLRLATHNFKAFSRVLLFSSLPLGILLFLNLVYSKIDTLILSFLRPSVEVGIYGTSYRFFELSIAVPAFLASSVYPILLQSQENLKEYKILFRKYLLLFFVASIVTTLLILLFSPILGFLKSDFSKVVLPLQILSLSLPFFFMTSLLQWHFLIKGKVKFLIPIYAFGLLINISLNIIFVPIYSYIASALITGLSEAIVFSLLLWYFVKRQNK
mgnify:CR=1 FL=1